MLLKNQNSSKRAREEKQLNKESNFYLGLTEQISLSKRTF